MSFGRYISNRPTKKHFLGSIKYLWYSVVHLSYPSLQKNLLASFFGHPVPLRWTVERPPSGGAAYRAMMTRKMPRWEPFASPSAKSSGGRHGPLGRLWPKAPRLALCGLGMEPSPLNFAEGALLVPSVSVLSLLLASGFFSTKQPVQYQNPEIVALSNSKRIKGLKCFQSRMDTRIGGSASRLPFWN